MAITLKAADVVAVDSTAMMILEGLKQSKIITLKAGFAWNGLSASDSRQLAAPARITRGNAQAGFSLDLPLTGRRASQDRHRPQDRRIEAQPESC